MDAAPATTTAETAANEPTILSRVDRLDIMMGYLEAIWGSKLRSSSRASTASIGSDEGGNLSVDSSPRSLDKNCRPIDDVIVETKIKGSLVDRLRQLEEHVLKLSLRLEEEIEGEKEEGEEEKSPRGSKKSHGKKGLKSLIKSCVKGKALPKD